MKGFMVFIALVLGYSMFNMVHLKVNASTYKSGVEAYLVKVDSVSRAPSIVSNK